MLASDVDDELITCKLNVIQLTGKAGSSRVEAFEYMLRALEEL